jgi:hypothetical protein
MLSNSITPQSPEIVLATIDNALEFALAKRIADKLHQKYPGYLWAVNIQGGMVDVRNLSLSGEWGFRLYQKAVQDDPNDKLAVMAGGEILERYKMRRGRIDEDQYHNLKTDFAGRHEVDNG